MKSWDEFEVGKQYRRIHCQPKGIYLMCIGRSQEGIPVMETNGGNFFAAASFDRGHKPEEWEECREPREWWAIDFPDRHHPLLYIHKEYAKLQADGRYKVFKVREVLE